MNRLFCFSTLLRDLLYFNLVNELILIVGIKIKRIFDLNNCNSQKSVLPLQFYSKE